MRIGTATLAVLLAVVIPSSPAAAAISHAPAAQPVADAITVASTSATYTVVAGSGQPNATSDSPLAGFPRHGTTFGTLTTGNVGLADDPNDSGASTGVNGFSTVRGTDTVFDLSLIRIDGPRRQRMPAFLRVPLPQ